MTDWSYEPLNSSHRQYSISSRDRPMQTFLPAGPSLPTSMSVPRCWLLRTATTAPRKVSQTNSQRDSSSEMLNPELKTYRITTLPNTSTTITASSAAIR